MMSAANRAHKAIDLGVSLRIFIHPYGRIIAVAENIVNTKINVVYNFFYCPLHAERRWEPAPFSLSCDWLIDEKRWDLKQEE
jgi:hypothetical protein